MGADGEFNLYSDEGDSYDYEKGAHAAIPIRWSEMEGKLTIGDRVGSYAGMPGKIKFDIVWVSANHGSGETVETRPERTVEYKGSAISVRRP
jgi:alpha-D-xyloside xylohydrolase